MLLTQWIQRQPVKPNVYVIGDLRELKVATSDAQFGYCNILYLSMKSDPDNVEKRAIYFQELADARLTDYYVLSDANKALLAEVERLQAVEAAAREMRPYITYRDLQI